MLQHPNVFATAAQKYLRAEVLSIAEQETMRRELDGPDTRNVAIACGALLRNRGGNHEWRSDARSRLRELCKTEDHAIRAELSFALTAIPREELCTPEIRDFIMSLLASPLFTRRCNGVCAAKRLAYMGDEEMVQRIKSISVDDSDERVRQNARNALLNLSHDPERIFICSPPKNQ